MLRSRALILLAAGMGVFAAPQIVQRDMAKPTDTEVLQFALTLEQIENAFYQEGLDSLDEQAFEAAGYPPWVRARFEQIKEHEATHVAFISNALGSAAPQPCTYNFPYNDPKSFAALSMALETVGTSAYIGAAHLLENKDTLTEAASILGVESRQAGWVSSAVLKGSAWDGAFETPLSMDGVYSLASQFVVSCPDSNPKLMVNILPKLEIEPGSPHNGEPVKFKFNHDAVNHDSQLYVAWFNGIVVQYSDLSNDHIANVPDGLQGTVYAGIVNEKAATPTAQTLLTGLAMFEINFPSYVSNP
ncbi:uncharacterized protein PHACADRAFT_91776 [Phanerochaete carnosa HHB-10118-sp]|uniref:Ferritin-like domain-containing protein n=1 Tax=Phanerochaete carnosa (strain HHB-10118-sp) TaxID=650164 RepID=K5V3X3_PHACS|nr:uncharacterized protein PHACADRAFT_91776 [Phanerochaete carnosa HHB-10118-sp]EKM57281.1 hypothetical protein PHACADRAFT_91776 [Phanerochaete carnosa HHB-10118-sp]